MIDGGTFAPTLYAALKLALEGGLTSVTLGAALDLPAPTVATYLARYVDHGYLIRRMIGIKGNPAKYSITDAGRARLVRLLTATAAQPAVGPDFSMLAACFASPFAKGATASP